MIQAFYLAIYIKPGTSPDENYHLNLSQAHKNKINPFINNTKSTYGLGDISRGPFLYHYINGLLLDIKPGNIDDLTYLRLFNPLLGILSLILLYLIMNEFTDREIFKLFAIFLMGSTLMFVFLSGFINYDNLLLPLMSTSFLFLIKFLKEFKIKDMLVSWLFLMLATITKETALPFVIVFCLIYLRAIIKNRKKIILSLKKFYSRKNFNSALILSSFFAISFLLNFFLYGINLIKYHTYRPGCDTILGHQTCYVYDAVYRRDYDYRITQNTNNTSTNLKLNDIYIWGKSYVKSSLGLITHRGTFFYKVILVPYSLSLLLSITALVKGYKKINPIIWTISAIICFYIIILFLYNYSNYLNLGKWMGIQGRYIFPILPLIYSVISYLISTIKIGKKYLTIIFLFLALFMELAGPIYFFLNIPKGFLK